MSTEKKPNKLLFLIPIGCCVLLIGLMLLMSGCQTSSIDALNVGAPQPLTVPAPATTASTEPASLPETTEAEAVTVSKTGAYPKIGNVPVGETNQLTKSDTSAIRKELAVAASKQTQKGKGEKLTKYQKELRKLRKKARTHGKDALKKIEENSE